MPLRLKCAFALNEHAMSDDNQLIAERREKLQALRAAGVAFPNDFKPKHHAADLHHKHGQVPNEELEPQAVKVSVAGRMMLKRVMGKACFATLQDASGRIQLYVTQDNVGPDVLAAFKHWDLGDIVGLRRHAVPHQDGRVVDQGHHGAHAH